MIDIYYEPGKKNTNTTRNSISKSFGDWNKEHKKYIVTHCMHPLHLKKSKIDWSVNHRFYLGLENSYTCLGIIEIYWWKLKYKNTIITLDKCDQRFYNEKTLFCKSHKQKVIPQNWLKMLKSWRKAEHSFPPYPFSSSSFTPICFHCLFDSFIHSSINDYSTKRSLRLTIFHFTCQHIPNVRQDVHVIGCA